MTFEDRVQIGIEYGAYIARNKIQIPAKVKDRRMIFVKWYFERYGNKSFNELFSELAEEVLYIKEVTLERIIFNEK